MAAAALALATEHGDAYNRISALSVLAEIHSRHGDGVGSPSVPNQALQYLESALELGATIDGYTVPGSLLDAAARAYAAAGDYAKAYDIALRASAARDKTHTQEATHRSIAMQIQYQTARAQTQSEHHRQLAAAEAQRAEVLQRTSATLAHLSQIGQEITAHLHATAVFRALDRHVHGLLDATHFSIYLLETDEESELGPDGASGAADAPPRAQYLRRAFGIEDGKQLPPTRVSMADTQRNSVRCVLERREIMIDVAPDTARPNLIPGTLPTLSLLFAPLQIGDHVLGVMTVQSLLGSAYGERERLIFRTLCAYGAIALDNAHAYRQVAATLRTLNETQAQLLEKNVELEQAYRALEQVSLTDQLTGLRNRRYFLQHVEADVAMSLRHYDNSQHLPDSEAAGPNKDLVFFMVDLDHFKQVNDRYGHAAGDAVLVQMQERLREVFRESDYLIRWGGEEFLALARATHRDDARLVAERIRAAVADRPFVLPDGVRLQKTCSVGFACFPFLPAQPRLLNWSQVVELADQGLYLAKNRGRNGWAGIYGTSTTMADGNFSRLLQSLEQSLRDRELELVSGPGPGDLAGEAGGALKRLG
jgi:diguanylate cyclase (GGDEF)-like protein